MSQKTIINYILVLGLVAFSGFPYFYDIDSHLIIFLIFSFFVWLTRKPQIKLNFLRFLSVFVLIFFLQLIIFKVFPLFSIAGFFAKVLLAYFVIQSMTINNFVNIYIRIIYFFSVISLIMFIPVLFDESLINFYESLSFSYVRGIDNINIRNTLFLLNLNFGDSLNIISRNSGPFWEPGAFGGFLIIALILNKIVYNKLFNYRGIIFTVAIVSTFSTTSYITLMFLIVTFRVSFSLTNIIVASLLIFLFSSIFQKIPFLQEKINFQTNRTASDDLSNSRKNRFGSFIVDMEDFLNYPISGRGVSNLTRYDTDDSELNNRNNGITDFLVKFGIIGFLFYFIGIYQSLKRIILFYKNKNKILLIFFFTLFLIGFSEPYFAFPFFIALSLLRTSQIS